jgi:hypothetical protein
MPAAARARRSTMASPAAKADPRFQKVLAQVKENAKRFKKHPPAAKKAQEAQAAAKGPANEKLAGAKAKQVDKMKEAEGKKPQPSGFLAMLRAEIEKVMPKNLDQADKFMEGGEKDQLKGAAGSNVAQQKQDAAGPVQQASGAAPNTAGVAEKPVTAMPAEPAVVAGQVDAKSSVPLPKSEAQVSQEGSKKDADQQLKDAEVTPEQLKKANDPRFSAVLGAKDTVAKVADASPGKYRAGEKLALLQGIGKAAQDSKKSIGLIGANKARAGTAVKSRQQLAKEKDEAERKKVTDTIEGIYTETKVLVEKKLSTLESSVLARFDRGITAALARMQSWSDQQIEKFKDDRYSGILGAGRWIADLFRPCPEGIKQILAEARTRFVAEMDALAVDVAGIVDARLKEAKDEVARGQKRIDLYVKGLPRNLQGVGKQAQSAVEERFKELEQGIDDKANELAQKLAEKYKEATEKADEALKKIESENEGALKALADKLGEVIKALLEFKSKLMAVLKKGADAIKQILADPIGFLGNLLAAVKMGFNQFVANIWTHLKRGFMAWLFGSLAGAGIQLPSDLSIGSILKLVMDVLGLTYAWIRGEAVKLIGERNVALIEKLFEYVMVVINGGPAALWAKIKEDLGNLKEMVIDAIQTWLIETVVKNAVAKVVSMFNPVGAIVQAVITIYNVVMFVVERASQIMELIEAIVNSISAIASGAIAGAANWIEAALGKLIPVAIGLLARIIGLGGISDKIKGFITKAQSKVRNAVLSWLKKGVVWVKKMFGALTGKGKGKDKKDDDDPAKQAKVDAGLAAIDAAEQPLLVDGTITKEQAEKVAVQVKSAHPVFKSITVVESADSWDYEYTASPKKKKKGEKKDKLANIKLKRPSSFWKATKEKLKELFSDEHNQKFKTRAILKKGYARRHIVASNTLIQHYLQKLNGKPLSEAKKLLESVKKHVPVPTPVTNSGLQGSAQEMVRSFFNETRNLFVGDSRENSAIQDDDDFPEGWSDAKQEAHYKKIRDDYYIKK